MEDGLAETVLLIGVVGFVEFEEVGGEGVLAVGGWAEREEEEEGGEIKTHNKIIWGRGGNWGVKGEIGGGVGEAEEKK